MSTPPRAFRRRVGEILQSDGIVSQEQVDEALAIQKKTGELLGAILMDMGVVSEADIAKTTCLQFQLPFICLQNYEIDEKVIQLLPKEYLHRHKILPFDRVGDMLLLMVAEIPHESVLAEIPKHTKLNAALYVGYYSEVDKHLMKLAPMVEPAKDSPQVPPQAEAREASTVQPSPQIVRKFDSDDSDEEGTQAGSAKKAKTIVFDGEKQTFLEELDSTWETIFQEVTASEPDTSK